MTLRKVSQKIGIATTIAGGILCICPCLMYTYNTRTLKGSLDNLHQAIVNHYIKNFSVNLMLAGAGIYLCSI